MLFPETKTTIGKGVCSTHAELGVHTKCLSGHLQQIDRHRGLVPRHGNLDGQHTSVKGTGVITRARTTEYHRKCQDQIKSEWTKTTQERKSFFSPKSKGVVSPSQQESQDSRSLKQLVTLYKEETESREHWNSAFPFLYSPAPSPENGTTHFLPQLIQ